MIAVQNISVDDVDRALNARALSFSTGAPVTKEIFPKDNTNKDWKVSTLLGSNMNPHQSHDSFLKGITVHFDIRMNNVVAPEVQRYHFYEIVMSQSTMHSLGAFLSGEESPYTKYVTEEVKSLIKTYYDEWVEAKELLKKEGMTPEEREEANKVVYKAYMKLRHNLPSGFELWQHVTTNYLQLKTICIQRHAHKNREDWNTFISACYSMPHFRELTGLTGSEWDIVPVGK